MMDESSLGKGLAVLGWILDHDEARADEIAEGLGLPASSTYRFLRTLRDRGFVASEDGTFTPGPRLTAHDEGQSRRMLAELAQPYLEQLEDRTGETAVLTVRQGFDALCAAQVQSSHHVRLAFRVGQLLPLHAGAGQRVLLAFAPDHVVQQVLTSELTPFTMDTPGPPKLLRSFHQIRADGYAVSHGELIPGAVALAVPVLRDGQAAAALSIAGPEGRCPMDWQAIAHKELARTAGSLAQALEERGL